jgi:hypothetical protein
MLLCNEESRRTSREPREKRENGGVIMIRPRTVRLASYRTAHRVVVDGELERRSDGLQGSDVVQALVELKAKLP